MNVSGYSYSSCLGTRKSLLQLDLALVMCEDMISLQPGRSEIIQGLRQLPNQIRRVLELDDKVLAIANEFYTSQVLCLIMFAMCEDRISLQPGRSKIIQGLKQFPVQIRNMLGLDDEVSTIAMGLPSGGAVKVGCLKL